MGIICKGISLKLLKSQEGILHEDSFWQLIPPNVRLTSSRREADHVPQQTPNLPDELKIHKTLRRTPTSCVVIFIYLNLISAVVAGSEWQHERLLGL